MDSDEKVVWLALLIPVAFAFGGLVGNMTSDGGALAKAQADRAEARAESAEAEAEEWKSRLVQSDKDFYTLVGAAINRCLAEGGEPE